MTNSEKIETLSKHEQLLRIGLEKGLFKITEGRIKYLALGKSYRFTDPEEVVRASTYTELIVRYGYQADRIDLEKYAYRREPKLPADIVVYDKARKSIFLVVECKPSAEQKEIEVARREGLGNATLLSADWLLLACGEEELVYYVSNKPSLETLEDCRVAELPTCYSEAPKYRFKKRGGVAEELRVVESKELDTKFQRCHDLIWDGGKRDPAEAFDEMSKLMFAKIYDEKYTKIDEYYGFQAGTNEAATTVSDRVRLIYSTVQEKEPGVFREPISVPDRIVFEVVKVLQDISLTRTDLDSKGRAFEKFLGKIFRGDFGQFFTPREVVDFIVKFVDVGYKDLVIDPACGSGGFLLYAIKHIIEKAEQEYGDDSKEVIWNFSHSNVFGIEVNRRLARIAMMDMVIHEDGHTNIECNDALGGYSTFEARNSIEPNKYNILMTNPPFGSRIRRETKDYFDDYLLSRNDASKSKPSEMSEIFFIERCIDLIKPDGRLAIVLPDSAFTNKSYIQVVEYIKSNTIIEAVISLPQHTFIPFGSMAKTSVLFLRKRNQTSKDKDNFVFMAHVEKVGYDANGRTEDNHLPIVLDEWHKFRVDEHYPEYTEILPELWITIVPSSKLEDKLDVEAYSKEYMDYLNTLKDYRRDDRFSVVRLDDICFGEKIFAGVGPATEDYVLDAGIPIIKTAAVRKVENRVGIIEWHKVTCVNYEKYKNSPKMLKQYDILIQSVAHTKDYIGDKVTIVDQIPEGIDKLLALGKFLVIRPDPALVNPYYLFLFLASPYAQLQYKHYTRGMTAEIYEFDIKYLWIILPKDRRLQDRVSEQLSHNLADLMDLEASVFRKKKEIAEAIDIVLLDT